MTESQTFWCGLRRNSAAGRALPPLLRGAFCLFLVAAASGCYTTRNVVSVTPLETKYPVSASGQYVNSEGAIVDSKQYRVVAPFQFEKTVTAPRHATTETRFDLEPELDRLVASGGGDAITELKIEGIGYDTGSHGTAAFWKQWGWAFGISGGTLLLVGAAKEDLREPLIPMGAIFAGVGALGFVFGALADDPAAWKFKISGQVVKTSAAAPPTVAPAAAPAGPIAAAPHQ